MSSRNPDSSTCFISVISSLYLYNLICKKAASNNNSEIHTRFIFIVSYIKRVLTKQKKDILMRLKKITGFCIYREYLVSFSYYYSSQYFAYAPHIFYTLFHGSIGWPYISSDTIFWQNSVFALGCLAFVASLKWTFKELQFLALLHIGVCKKVAQISAERNYSIASMVQLVSSKLFGVLWASERSHVHVRRESSIANPRKKERNWFELTHVCYLLNNYEYRKVQPSIFYQGNIDFPFLSLFNAADRYRILREEIHTS